MRKAIIELSPGKEHNNIFIKNSTLSDFEMADMLFTAFTLYRDKIIKEASVEFDNSGFDNFPDYLNFLREIDEQKNT